MKARGSLRSYLLRFAGLLAVAFLLLSPPVREFLHRDGFWNVFTSEIRKLFVRRMAAPAAVSDYKVHGIDVSYYQGRINWKKVKLAKPSFAFIKATQGQRGVDKRFAQNWKNAREAGLIRGAYHFFTPSLDAEAQARNFIKQVKLEPGDLPPVLDVERTEGKTAEEIRAGVNLWLEEVEDEYNLTPILYTNYRFYQRYLEGHYSGYPIWIAHYTHQAPEIADGGGWHFWQHSETGTVSGISKPVDLNVYSGTLDELRQLCKP